MRKMQNSFIPIVLVMFMFMLSGCTVETFNIANEEMNITAYQRIAEGEFDEAISILNDILEVDDNNETALNNMSRVLYLTGNYHEAYDYIKRSLEILPNSDVEYVNEGNILLEISDDVQEAASSYEKALSINPKSSSAFYGKGTAYMCMGDYKSALTEFEKYAAQEPDDPGGIEKLGYVDLYMKNYEEAESYAEILADNGAFRKRALILKASCRYALGDKQQSDILLSEYLSSSDDFTSYENICNFVYGRGDYDDLIKLYTMFIDKSPHSPDPYINLAYTYIELEEYDKAQYICRDALNVFPENAVIHNTLGDVYAGKTAYDDAIISYRSAYNLDPSYSVAESNLIWAMYMAQNYGECIDFCKKLDSEGKGSFEVYWYIGACYEAVFEPEQAIEFYGKSIPFDQGDDSNTHYLMAMQYMLKRDPEKAREAVKLSLDVNSRNSDSIWLLHELNLAETSVANQLAEFIGRNYLYQEYDAGFKESIESLKLRGDIDFNTINDKVQELLNDNDYFSFILVGDYYSQYKEMEETPTVSYNQKKTPEDNILHWFRIDSFSMETNIEFRSLADKIKNSQNENLVIDLRGNSGGDMKASSDILNYLLDKCVTCSLIDKDGYMHSIYSDEDKAAFKNIAILTDEYTASAAELLTLGLMLYAENATVIGAQTYGKGVSQLVFDSPENNFALFLVSLYWNVREVSINYYGITPDVVAKSEKEYEAAINKLVD